MGREVDLRSALENLLNVAQRGDKKELSKAITSTIWEASNLFELTSNFVFLERKGFHFPLGSSTIKKGTILYRIRDYSASTDYSQLSEWGPSPFKSQNRANRQGQEALYLANSEDLCFLETHKKPDEIYVLGKYECLDDIHLGGFFGETTYSSNYEWLLADVLNAFFLAPARSEKNAELFVYLDQKIGKITPDDLSSVKKCLLEAKEEVLLPYKFAVMNQKKHFYDLTNDISDIIERYYPYGIKYSSCFLPLGNPFVDFSDYNVVLYSPALKSIRLLDYKVKTLDIKNKEAFTDVNVARVLLGDKDDVKA